MNSRPYAPEILNILKTLQSYLPKDRSESAYTMEQAQYLFDEVVGNIYSVQMPPDDFWSILNEVNRRFAEQLHDLALGNDNKLMPDDIENSLVKAFYEQYFERTFTCKQLMNLHPEIDPLQYLPIYQNDKFFDKGQGGSRQLAMDVNRGTLINGKKINDASEDTIEQEVNAIVQNENITKRIIGAHSQAPTYLFSLLIAESMKRNDKMMMKISEGRRENIRFDGKELYFECSVKSIPIIGMTNDKPVIHVFDGAKAKFIYEKQVLADQSTVEGYKLLHIKTCDPYLIMVLTEGQAYTHEQIMDYVSNYYPVLMKKIMAGQAKLADLDSFLMKNFIYQDILLKDLKQKIRLFSSNTDADGIRELIKSNNNSLINSLEDVKNVCDKRIKSNTKSYNKDAFFLVRPSSREPEVHLFYEACVAFRDCFSMYPAITTVEELIDAHQKIKALYYLKKELNERTNNKQEGVNGYMSLINNIRDSSPSQSLIKIIENSSLMQDKHVQSIYKELLDPKAVIEKLNQGKRDYFQFKF